MDSEYVYVKALLQDVFCVDESRVVLTWPPGSTSDYIHANWVSSPSTFHLISIIRFIHFSCPSEAKRSSSVLKVPRKKQWMISGDSFGRRRRRPSSCCVPFSKWIRRSVSSIGWRRRASKWRLPAESPSKPSTFRKPKRIWSWANSNSPSKNKKIS